MTSSDKKYYLKSGIFSFGQRYSSIILGFGIFFFLVRIFSKYEFGAWALFMAITAVVEVARNGLIRNASVRYINFEKNDTEFINTASFILNILFSILISIVLYFSASLFTNLWDLPEMKNMLHFYIITILIMTFNSQFEYILFANKDFRGAFFGTATRFGVLFLFVLSSFIAGYSPSLINLVNVQSLAALFSSLVLLLFAKPYLNFSKQVRKDWLKKLLDYGKYTFGTNISSMLNRYIDQTMVGAMISPIAVAGYNTAIRVSTLIEAPTLAVASIVFPKSAEIIKTGGKEAVKDVYEKSVASILAITLPALIIGIIFPEEIILIIAGKEYLDSTYLLQITIFYSFFIPFARQFGTIFDSIGKPKLNFYFVILNAVLNLIFNYIFIQKTGINGAAYGTLTSYSIIFIINQIILKKTLGINTLNTIKYIPFIYSRLFETTRTLLQKQIS